METLIQQIDSLMALPAGSQAYHLVLILAITGGLQASLFFWQRDRKPHKAHIPVSFVILLFVQLISFIIEGLGWKIITGVGNFGPVFDRSISLFCLILIIWVWAFPMFMRPSSRLALIAAVLDLILVAIIAAISLVYYSYFHLNSIQIETIWQVVSLITIIIGVVLFIVKRPPALTLGFIFLGISFLGHLTQLLFPSFPDQIPGIVHIGELFAFPLIVALPYRSSTSKPGINTPRPPGQERRRYSADPKSVHAFLSLAIENDPTKAGFTMARCVSQAILADLCILMSETQNKNIINIEGGYDLIREKELDGLAIEKEKLPLVSNAIDQGRCLRFPANSSTTVDTNTLSSLFALSNVGNVLVAPLLGPGQSVLGGFVLLSPYSNRLWNSDDQAYLSRIAEDITPIYLRFHQVKQQTSETEKLQTELSQANHTISELKDTLASVRVESDQIRNNSDKGISALAETSHYENELRLALIEVAKLQNALAQANMRILQMEKESTPRSNPAGIEGKQEDSVETSNDKLQ